MKVLFVGNSYTYYNDLPKLFCALALENGIEAQIDSVTVGGRRLYENLNSEDEKNAEIRRLLQQAKYDVLVLQEQSHTPMTDYPTFEKGVEGLISLVKPDRTVLYATWGRKDGSELLVERGLTSAEMTARLTQAYENVAERFGAEISRVGECFGYIYSTYPEIELYDADRSHPSYSGSCVAVLTHYKRIFGSMPQGLSCLKLDSAALEKIICAIERITE